MAWAVWAGLLNGAVASGLTPKETLRLCSWKKKKRRRKGKAREKTMKMRKILYFLKKKNFQKSHFKTALIIFCDISLGMMVHEEFLEVGCTINAKYYYVRVMD